MNLRQSGAGHPPQATKILDYIMDMSSESSAARWYEPPRSLGEPAGGAGGATSASPASAAAGNNSVGNPQDYRGYYPHAAPTHHPAAHYAHSEYIYIAYMYTLFTRRGFCALGV